jgi:hypothetical protein
MFEIYVRPFPGIQEGRWQISNGGGRQPAWAPTGRELYYYQPADASIMSVNIEPGSGFEARNPVRLLEVADYDVAPGERSYDISRDNRRFLMMKDENTSAEREFEWSRTGIRS